MSLKPFYLGIFICGITLSCLAQEPPQKPVELEVLQASVGIWDAEIEVWPQGLDAPSIQFTGVETNRAFGEYWITSDFDSEYGGQTMKIHSIVGYDLEQQKLVGTVIDQGPYSASLSGEYDQTSKTIHWTTKAMLPNGTPMLQKTTITHPAAGTRILVLSMPSQQIDEYTKFMEIKFTKRSQ